MIKYLAKNGTNEVLVITKEMRAHLGLSDGRVQVEFYGGRIIVTKPRQQYGDDPCYEQYLTAFKNLGL